MYVYYCQYPTDLKKAQWQLLIGLIPKGSGIKVTTTSQSQQELRRPA
jgi:hypothetical protein